MRAAEETGRVGLTCGVVGTVGHGVAVALPDDGTGWWGVVCAVLTLWGWGLVASPVLLAVLAVVFLLSHRFARAPRWLVAPLTVGAALAAAPVLAVALVIAALLADDSPSQPISEL